MSKSIKLKLGCAKVEQHVHEASRSLGRLQMYLREDYVEQKLLAKFAGWTEAYLKFEWGYPKGLSQFESSDSIQVTLDSDHRKVSCKFQFENSSDSTTDDPPAKIRSLTVPENKD